MNTYTIVNIIASLLITVSVTGFILMVYRPGSPVDEMPLPLKAWIKLSLVSVAAGSLFNVLTMSTPVWSEVLLNVGVGGLFSWAFFWHRIRWNQLEGECE